MLKYQLQVTSLGDCVILYADDLTIDQVCEFIRNFKVVKGYTYEITIQEPL